MERTGFLTLWTERALFVIWFLAAVGSPLHAQVVADGATRTDTNVVLSGTNGPPNAPYVVLASTNVTLPLSNWGSIATNQFNTGGGFTFTNTISPAFRQRFSQLRVP